MLNTFIDKQVEKCIEDDARRSLIAPRRANIRYCGLLNPNNKDTACLYKGNLLVLDTNVLVNQRLREVYECLYFKGDAA